MSETTKHAGDNSSSEKSRVQGCGATQCTHLLEGLEPAKGGIWVRVTRCDRLGGLLIEPTDGVFESASGLVVHAADCQSTQ